MIWGNIVHAIHILWLHLTQQRGGLNVSQEKNSDAIQFLTRLEVRDFATWERIDVISAWQ